MTVHSVRYWLDPRKAYQQNQDWFANNPGKKAEYHRRYYSPSAKRYRENAKRRSRTCSGWVYGTWHTAKRRAKKRGQVFAISRQDILDVLPPDEKCPVFGTPFKYGGRVTPSNASLDCLVPSRGYVPGNIAVISYLANTMKQNVGVDEVRALLAWMEGVL